MTLTFPKSISELSGVLNASGPAVSWKEPLGGYRNQALPLATSGYEVAGTLGGIGETFELVLANGGSGEGSVVIGDGEAGIIYTLAEGVSSASIEHAATDAAAVEAMVDVAGNVVTVTPGGVATLFINAGLLDVNGDALPAGALAYEGLEAVGPYAPSWGDVANNHGWWTQWVSVGDGWAIAYGDENGYLAEFWGWCNEMTTQGSAILPNDPRLTWTPNDFGDGPQGSGTLVCTGGTTASQVFAALDASTAAEALLTFTLVGTGADSISSHAAVTLASTAGTDIEGNALAAMTAINGLEIVCAAGGVTVEFDNGALPFPLAAGGVLHFADVAGTADLLATLTLTATAVDTAFNVTVLGH